MLSSLLSLLLFPTFSCTQNLPYPDIRDAIRLPAAPHHDHGLATAAFVTGRGEGDIDQLLVATAAVGAAFRVGFHV